MESGTPKRDTPDNEDFEGEPEKSGQLPEEAPPEVTERDERKDGDEHQDSD